MAHAASCAICRDVVTVAGAIRCFALAVGAWLVLAPVLLLLVLSEE